MNLPASLILSAVFLLSGLQVSAAEPSLEQRVRILEDKEAIRTLLLNYGRYLDRRDWDAFAGLFASDGGTWDGGMGVAHGPEAIRNMMLTTIGSAANVGKNGSGQSNLHLFTNEIIDVNGDTASALSKWVFVMTAEDGGPEAVFVGHYMDDLVKLNGEWKFKNRVVHGDITRPTALNGLDDKPAP